MRQPFRGAGTWQCQSCGWLPGAFFPGVGGQQACEAALEAELRLLLPDETVHVQLSLSPCKRR